MKRQTTTTSTTRPGWTYHVTLFNSTPFGSVCLQLLQMSGSGIFPQNQPRVVVWLGSGPLRVYYYSVDQPAQWLLVIDAGTQSRSQRELQSHASAFFLYLAELTVNSRGLKQGLMLWSVVKTPKVYMKSCLNTSKGQKIEGEARRDRAGMIVRLMVSEPLELQGQKQDFRLLSDLTMTLF